MSNPFAKLSAPTHPIDPEIKSAVRAALASNASAESHVNSAGPAPTVMVATNESQIPDGARLSQLVDDSFPFDESQLAAVNGMVSQQYACLTGAAGTGKTTVTKKLVDTLLNSVSTQTFVNMAEYFKAEYIPDDSDDEYERNSDWVPSVCIVGFTGKSTQAIKRNFPADWHGNIMTIHRMLAYKPEFYEDFNENGALIKKMRFVPTYTRECKLPWDIILIDEAGMVSAIDLWPKIWEAAKQGCRIYMIGDINQLPPVHGRSIFGFAMAKWPTWELTHVHRQKGKNNPIVDNAWRVLKGQLPISEGNFQMMPLKGDAQYSSRQVRAIAPKLKEMGIYEPNRDTIITPVNGEDGSRGFALGQLPLNREFAQIFNPQSENPRYQIDGGREKKQFAVGDKVMATRNDHEIGITNGMTGIIVSIARNEAYAGEAGRFGTAEEIKRYMADTGQDEDDRHIDLSLEDLNDQVEAVAEGLKNKKEKAERGPASHIVTVRFGDEDHGKEVAFGTLAEVASLMTAYVVTCHKMQGAESPTIIIILHDAHKAMLYREWLYTAITRASQRCILLYTTDALRVTVNKQNIKGKTLQEKVAAFNALQDKNSLFGGNVGFEIPDACAIKGAEVDLSTAIQTKKSEPSLSFKELIEKTVDKPKVEVKLTQVNIFAKNLNVTVQQVALPEVSKAVPIESPAPIDLVQTPKTRLVSQMGAYQMWQKLNESKPLLLTHQPSPVQAPTPAPEPAKSKPVNPFAFIAKK